MFHDIGHINLSAIYASRSQRFIQKFSRRTDEGPSRAIFLIAGLFAYEHYCGFWAAFPKHRLGCSLPKITRPTVGCLFS
jgi:hypothetical protein